MTAIVIPGSPALVLSCEHGGNNIPDLYTALFKNGSEILNSHRGWDLGALALFGDMAGPGVDYMQYSEVSRLLIDLNRSPGHRSLFSEFTRFLSREAKETILSGIYRPYRNEFKLHVGRLILMKQFVIHISVHSFTPVFKGEERQADVGLLYDPGFGIEKKLAGIWRKTIHRYQPGLKVRMNYPYLGKTDGHVTSLRKCFGENHYAGIELEINQKYAFDNNFNKLFSDAFRRFLACLV